MNLEEEKVDTHKCGESEIEFAKRKLEDTKNLLKIARKNYTKDLQSLRDRIEILNGQLDAYQKSCKIS